VDDKYCGGADGGKGEEGQETIRRALDGGQYEMEERMKAEGMKGVSRLVMFSSELLARRERVTAMRCFLDALPTYPGKR
jgi:hypothetical protein